MSQRATLSSTDVPGATLLHELLGTLRRCLRKGADVRRAIYVGLPALVSQDKPAQVMVSQVLLDQLKTVVQLPEQGAEIQGQDVLVDLKACLRHDEHPKEEEDLIAEPLPELLRAVQEICLPWKPDQHGVNVASSEALQSLSQTYLSVQSAWTDATLEYFGVRELGGIQLCCPMLLECQIFMPHLPFPLAVPLFASVV